MQPTVSVIIPAYNAASFVQETIKSVLDQTFHDFELIVVDDGSTDQTSEIIKKYKDKRIRYFFKSNSGVSETRNFGLENAKGDVVAFLDADDLFLPTNLEKKVFYLRANPETDLVHSSEIRFSSATGENITTVFGSEGKVLEKLLAMRGNVIHSPSSVVVRKRLLDQVGGFDPKLSTSADWDMWVRLSAKTPFGYIPEPLVKYRVHAAQMHNNIKLMDRDMHYAMHKHYQEGLFSSSEQYKYCLANMRLILSACYLGDERNITRSLKYFLLSMSDSPKPAIDYLLTKLKLR